MQVTGIYILKFKGTHKVYVGQSTDIHKRYKEHKYKLNKGIHQPKLQNAFNKYGMPELEITYECSNSELDVCENEAIEIWNAIDDGYNFQKDTSFHGPSLPGELATKAQYTNDVYISIFMELINTTNSIDYIANKLQVNKNVVYQISNGSSHRRWLERLYPTEYQELISRVGSRNNRFSESNPSKVLISKDGIEYTIKGTLTDFAKEHSLNRSHLGAVLNGSSVQHKGWRLKG